jgi:CRISPR-associated endonuclease/helicase Cas3
LESSLAVAPFHSRYRYKDRLVRQRCLIDGFAPGRPAMLGMTTQVAEVSLDLSADLLVTEYAPVPSLIQRLGRLNRYEEEPKEIRKALLIKPESALPYAARKEDEERFYRQVQTWLDQVADGAPKSQKELGAAFLGIESEETGLSSRDLFCDWLDEPWSSLNNRHALMEGGYTVEMVRQEDLGEGPLAELAIPMPFPKDSSWHEWDHKGRYLIAPMDTIDYDPFWGGKYVVEKSQHWVI